MKSSDVDHIDGGGQLLLGASAVNDNGFHNGGGEEDSNRAGLAIIRMFSLRLRMKRKSDVHGNVD